MQESREVLYRAVAGLEVTIDRVSARPLERAVSSGFTRYTTEVLAAGGGHEGRGEDVTYEEEAQKGRPGEIEALDLRGTYRWDELSDRLEEDLPAEEQYYARWGVEGALLDLALRQAGLRLPDLFDRPFRPLRFVVSTRLGSPPTAEIPLGWLSHYPDLEFKLDPQSSWSDELAARLAATGRVRIVDLKGAYVGTPVDQPFDERLYRLTMDAFPDAYIEDPAPCPPALALLAAAHDRLSWDAVIHSAADIRSLELRPGAINIKPSRFGSVRRLLGAIEYCLEAGIPMYGGGQFELGPGRSQIQAVASLFYPAGPNDVAPQGFNVGEPRPGLPRSPLHPGTSQPGFAFPG